MENRGLGSQAPVKVSASEDQSWVSNHIYLQPKPQPLLSPSHPPAPEYPSSQGGPDNRKMPKRRSSSSLKRLILAEWRVSGVVRAVESVQRKDITTKPLLFSVKQQAPFPLKRHFHAFNSCFLTTRCSAASRNKYREQDKVP